MVKCIQESFPTVTVERKAHLWRFSNILDGNLKSLSEITKSLFDSFMEMILNVSKIRVVLICVFLVFEPSNHESNQEQPPIHRLI